MKPQRLYKLETDDEFIIYKSQWQRLRNRYYQDFMVVKFLPDKFRKWYKPWTWFRKMVLLRYVG